MITAVPGIKVGHYTEKANFTGCTVILCPEGTTGSADVRGPAPGSRETALLSPEKPVSTVHGILLTGRSIFGLAAADGVVQYLEEQGQGHWTPFGRVPIVPGAVVYDLFMGDPKIRPTAASGYQACLAAASGDVQQGCVGAGTGTTVGKWAGFHTMMKGGFGTASWQNESLFPGLVIGGAVVTNCVGDVVNEDGTVLAGARMPDGRWVVEENPLRNFPERPPATLTNTTLAVVATNARLSKVQCNLLAQRMHDALAISIRPVHTTHDGDTAFALATGQVDLGYDAIANIAVAVICDAVRNSVKFAQTTNGILGLAN